MSQVKLRLTGMTCASCANNIDRILKDKKGIDEVFVNLANDTAHITYNDKMIRIDEMIEAITQIGYDAEVDKQEKTVTFHISGMTCAMCQGNVERAVRQLKGVMTVHVNLVSEHMTVTYDTDMVSIASIKKAVYDAGYEAHLLASKTEEVNQDVINMKQAKRKVIIALGIAAVMMTLMVIHMFFYEIPFYQIIIAILGAPVVFILGYKVHRGSFFALKNRHPNMDVLVSLGSLPPYFIGLLGIFLPIQTFIEMATTIVTFHLLGKYLEARAKGKASQAIKKLAGLSAKTARVIIDEAVFDIQVDELSIGDIMLVKPGEKIPMDGLIIEGKTTIDESMATGESMPVMKSTGDEVIGATINGEGLLKIKVTKVGKDSFLQQMIELVESCQGTKVPIQAFADKITGYFVPAILIVTVLTFFFILLFPSINLAILNTFSFLPWIDVTQPPLTRAFITATAVLVIACPCALGLGTPTALMVGSGLGAKHGILIRQGEAIQTLKDIEGIAFDKTGTLTEGKPVVTHIISNRDDLLYLAASIESASEHVLARAILQYAKQKNVNLGPVKDFTSVTGMGVLGTVDDNHVIMGNERLMQEEGLNISVFKKQMDVFEKQAQTVMFVAVNRKVEGLIAIADQIKPEVKQVIKSLHHTGIHTIMLTGDHEQTAQAIAKQSGIKTWISNVLPEGKVDAVKQLQSKYGTIAMIGDGINDAPALKQANVGIAIGTGTDIAIESADIILVNGQLDTILKAVALSKATFKKIKQNYFWAWFYNALMIPFAMLGLLHPMIGAAAMSLSSLNVIYNSLRLKKVNLLETEVSHEA